jgi:hypothetical protein
MITHSGKVVPWHNCHAVFLYYDEKKYNYGLLVIDM